MAHTDPGREGNVAATRSGRRVATRLHRPEEDSLDTLVPVLWAQDAHAVDGSRLVHVHFGEAVSQSVLTRFKKLAEFSDHLPASAGIRL